MDDGKDGSMAGRCTTFFLVFDRAAAAFSRLRGVPPACAQLIRGSRSSAATIRGETYLAHFFLRTGGWA